MSPDALRHRLKQTPFRPFEVVLSSGGRYPVAGPEHLVVGARTSALWTGRPDDDLIFLDNLHITDLPPVAASSGSA